MGLLKIGRGLTNLVVSVGVGSVVGNIIQATTPKDIKPVAKVLVRVGGFVLTSMIADMAVDYVSAQIDNVISDIEKAKAEKRAYEDLEKAKAYQSSTEVRSDLGIMDNKEIIDGENKTP